MTDFLGDYMRRFEPQGDWSPGEVRNILVYGNCQAHAVYHALGLVAFRGAPLRFIFAPNHPPGTPGYPGETELADEVLASLALVLWQYEQFDNPRAHAIASRLPAGVPTVRFPAVFMPCLWPFVCPEPRAVPEARFHGQPRFPYGDMVALEVAAMQLPGPLALEAYMELSHKRMPDLQVRLARDLERLRKSDASGDVPTADFVEHNFRRQHVVWCAYGHGGDPLVGEIATRLAGAASDILGPMLHPLAGAQEQIRGVLGVSSVQMPIHPAVAQAYDLAFWGPDMRYEWMGQHWTFAEYTERHIAYDTRW